METIILASRSPRRAEILKSAGIPFEIVSADADETPVKSVTPAELTMGLASRKLRAVFERIGDEKLILAADTVVCRNGEIFGKPKDEDDAVRMLTLLSDGWHEVYTGIAMRKNGKLVIDYDVTHVRMRKMEPSEIKAYVKTKEPMDKAGAYAVQERGSVFVSRLDGSFHNVVGLPVSLVCSHLSQDYGIYVLE